MADSYSAFERKFMAPARRLLAVLFAPIVRLLAALHITPNMVSFSQIPVGILVVALMPTQPRLAFLLFLLSLALDGIDGALARATDCATPFGALFDQYCDHIREVTVVSGLALYGVLNPLFAGLYGVTYPLFNLTLYLTNTHGVPLPIAAKSYLVVYPALLAYLVFGIDWIDPAVGLSILLMGLLIAQGLLQLRRAMTGPVAAEFPS